MNISDNNWIANYHELILSEKSNEALHLKRRHFPKHLYKFSRINNYTSENLEKNSFWLASIYALNDPFECALLTNVGDYFRACLTQKTFFEDFFKKHNVKFSDSEIIKMIESREPYRTFCSISLKYGAIILTPEEKFCEKQGDWKKILDDAKKKIRVCSFTERFDSILMWSHYAEQHQGICIEYDFSNEKQAALVHPVLYSDKFYNMKAHHSGTLNLKLSSLTKSKDWEYEKEWRIAMIAGDTDSMRIRAPMPKTIYLGVNFEENDYEKKKGFKALKNKLGISLKRIRVHPFEYRMEILE